MLGGLTSAAAGRRTQVPAPQTHFFIPMAEKSPRVKITGLWANETKDGVRYLSGGKSPRYSIWPNSFKEKDTDPTHVLYVEAPLKKDGDNNSKGESKPF